ncbi:Fc receptor-like protein 5 [Scomber scombrus]|uniref:Fc receptor-like protein 5 n=1 Tax=Scomber scombrus TaxID=13677 RepID=UPI002DDAE3F1|nr:Fc receptor-like protein 5 [Scomber scombrus]
MEVTALCIRLLVTVLTLTCSNAQKDDAALSIQPSRLQFFEYESVTLHCGEFNGSTGWKIVHESKIPIFVSNSSSYNIKTVYLEDSGEYYCEAAGGRKSNSINITVTNGSVILESPALPVMEGNTVTLRCRNKTTSTNPTADFYKDGLFIRSSSTGEMIIYSVSKSDEGLYKCNISGTGESPESWLAVRVSPPESKNHSHPSSSSAVPWIIVTCLLVVLLVVVGIQCFGKDYWLRDGDEALSTSAYYTLGLDKTEQLDEEELSLWSGAFYYAFDGTQQLAAFSISIESSAVKEDKSAYASATKTRKRKVVTVLTLLCSYAQKDDAALSIQPSRLQFFEYESVTLHFGEFNGSTGWTIVHQFKGEIPKCVSNSSSYNIKTVYPEDSGEYYCEAAGGRRSNIINITVTTGSVILESPALPVMEGNNVTLRCRNKTTSANPTADFYKDGLFIRSSSTGEMIIYSVSKSDEGLYKCNISGAGESPESLLAVKAFSPPESKNHSHPSSSSAVPWIIVTCLLVVMLVVVGIQCFGKDYWLRGFCVQRV